MYLSNNYISRARITSHNTRINKTKDNKIEKTGEKTSGNVNTLEQTEKKFA